MEIRINIFLTRCDSPAEAALTTKWKQDFQDENKENKTSLDVVAIIKKIFTF